MKTIRKIAGIILLLACTNSLYASDLNHSVTHGGITVCYPDAYKVTESENSDCYQLTLENDIGKARPTYVGFSFMNRTLSHVWSIEEIMPDIKEGIEDNIKFLNRCFKDFHRDDIVYGKYGDFSGSFTFKGKDGKVEVSGQCIVFLKGTRIIHAYLQTPNHSYEWDNMQAIVKSIQLQ